MTNGLFTSSEEIRLQKEYMAPVARLEKGKKSKRKKLKPLFTSPEEMKFQSAYIRGNIEPQKGFSINPQQMHQESRRIAQNIKQLNLSAQRCMHTR